MPRRQRVGMAGLIFHVINRAAKRARLFETQADYEAFESLLIETREVVQISLLAYCLMPNHWHLVVWPEHDNDLSMFMKRLTGTHALRWNAHRLITGVGAVYQGRFKAIPVQANAHFLRLCRYVERNPVRAGLVTDATHWRWSSLWRRLNHCDRDILSRWPAPVPENWRQLVAEDSTPDDDTDKIRESIKRNTPFGTNQWRKETANRLRTEPSLRCIGRPRKQKNPPDPLSIDD